MFSATIRITFDAAHRVLGHTGKCRFLHGHSYVAELTFVPIDGKLSELGFVEDFGVLKKLIKDWIDANWDHNMILNPDDPVHEVFIGNPNYCLADLTCGRDPYSMPKGVNPTAELMAKELFFVASTKLINPKDINVKVIKVKIQETENSWAEYTGYTS